MVYSKKVILCAGLMASAAVATSLVYIYGVQSWGKPKKPRSIKKTVKVPRKFLGKLIGKNGSNIKRIEVRCQVVLSVNSSEEATEDDVVDVEVIGFPIDVARAEAEIAGVVLDGTSERFVKTIVVPSEFVSFLIGKGGKSVRCIRDNFGVEVDVSRSGGKLESVDVTGDPKGVMLAIKEIEARLEEFQCYQRGDLYADTECYADFDS